MIGPRLDFLCYLPNYGDVLDIPSTKLHDLPGALVDPLLDHVSDLWKIDTYMTIQKHTSQLFICQTIEFLLPYSIYDIYYLM